MRRWHHVTKFLSFLLLLTLCFSSSLLFMSGGSHPGRASREAKKPVVAEWWKMHRPSGPFLALAERIIDGSELIGTSLDIHLFVIWQRAYPWREAILRDIQRSFVVLELAEFDWDDAPADHRKFLVNLWVLYGGKGGWDMNSMGNKVQHCGIGRFIAVILADLRPRYGVKSTAHGVDTVNIKMHAKKSLYRSWSGGGFKVHGTFSILEANHDIRLLFHVTLEEVLQRAIATRAYASDLVSHYLEQRSPFETTQEVYGFAYTNGSKQVEWKCASFFFALAAMTQVRVMDEVTGEVLWTQHTSPKGQPFRMEIATHLACNAWPERILIQVPLLEMWSVVALLHATPLTEKEVTLDSNFIFVLEGSARSLRLEPLA